MYVRHNGIARNNINIYPFVRTSYAQKMVEDIELHMSVISGHHKCYYLLISGFLVPGAVPVVLSYYYVAIS